MKKDPKEKKENIYEADIDVPADVEEGEKYLRRLKIQKDVLKKIIDPLNRQIGEEEK